MSNRAPPQPQPPHPGTDGSVAVAVVAIEAESVPTAKPPPPAPPSWMRALAEVSPFLRPRDRRRAALLACAMGLTLLEKVVAVLPPLAIRRAVDAISSSSFSSIAEEENDDDDDGPRRRTARTVAMSIASYFLLKTLDTAVSSFQGVCQRSVSLDAERRFASRLFSHLQVLGISYHLERHAGEVSRVLSRGADATSTIIDSMWFGLLPTFFEAAVVGTVFAKVLGVPSIAFTTLASVALYLAYTVGVTSTRLDQRRKVIEKNEAVGRIETETLVNYETVAIFGRERKAAEEYDAVRGEYADARVEMLSLFAWLQLGQQSIRLAGTCAGLWLAGRAAVYGTGGGGGGGGGVGTTNNLLSPGSFVVVQLYINQLFEPLSYLGYIFRQVTEAVTDLEKAVVIMKSAPSVAEMPDAVEWDVALEERGRRRRRDASGPTCEDGAAAAATSGGDITFDDVTFQYTIKSQTKKLGGGAEVDDATNAGKVGKRRGWRGKGFSRTTTNGGGRRGGRGLGGKRINAANDDGRYDEEDEVEKIRVGGIRNVSFHIPAGKTAALVGPSGSGKTTIVRLILRMYDPDDGSVMVDGMNVKRLLLHSLRSNMGVVAQETVLFHASLRRNIMYGKDDATEDEVWEAVRISALETLVKSLPEGLDTVVGERGMKLSGGERQRVG